MRKARLKAPPSYPVAYYHCVSRVVDRQFLLGDEEKEQWVFLLREYERFCGVRVIAYCVMSNHFHLLVEVPERPKQSLSDEALIGLLKRLSGMSGVGMIRQQLAGYRERKQHKAAEALRERVMARMWDVSAFMKTLKQRFSQWYNHQHGRKGTLWEERFKSVLVEGAGEVLATLAAYIDLNPVRAGLVEDPKEYRWCGYGDAVRGGRQARAGLRWVMRAALGKEVSGQEALAGYRVWLFGPGEANEGVTEGGQAMRRGLSRKEVVKAMAGKGRLPLSEYLRLRVRYFADGAVVGTRNYVDQVFNATRERYGVKRKDGARRLRGVQSELYSMRALRIKPLG
jgi:REP element-mobilizing transposase RayT